MILKTSHTPPPPVSSWILSQTPSTQSFLKQQLYQNPSLPHGSWALAKTQTQGKGRRNRLWHSLEGNLFVSLLIDSKKLSIPPSHWSWIPLLTALFILNALEKKLFALPYSFPSSSTASTASFSTSPPTFPLSILWPNDLFFKDKKWGGILCEMISLSSRPVFIIGMGLNLVHAPCISNKRTTSLKNILSTLQIPSSFQKDCIEDPKTFWEKILFPSLWESWTRLDLKIFSIFQQQFMEKSLLKKNAPLICKSEGKTWEGVFKNYSSQGALQIQLLENKKLKTFFEADILSLTLEEES